MHRGLVWHSRTPVLANPTTASQRTHVRARATNLLSAFFPVPPPR
jgi:hypothetical protein